MMKNRNNRITTIFLALSFFALSAIAHAVSPPPDGGYPGGNTAEGQNALLSLTSGSYNTALGLFSLESNITGNFNTGVGAGTLLANTADGNTATGAGALLSNTTGGDNTAVGAFALFSNTIGSTNTATGFQALFSNTEGNENTANGWAALVGNTSGSSNTATGYGALASNITGTGNTANGDFALVNNEAGGGNTAVGYFALNDNIGGTNNTANGYLALQHSTGDRNTAIGIGALENATGNNNTAVGAFAGAGLDTGDNNIDIGNDVVGLAGESNTIRIGNTDITDTFIRGISGATASGGAAVFVNGNGKLGTMTSSARFKEEIKPMDSASEVLFSLKPVTFRYKKEIDPAGTQQFGLVAEDVEKVNAELVVRDETGKVNSVRYEQVNAMLLNEFLKEHKEVEEQQVRITDLNSRLAKQEVLSAQQQKSFQSRLAEQAMQIEALASGLQKVSAHVEISKPARKVVSNRR
jgi:hypothetical protein